MWYIIIHLDHSVHSQLISKCEYKSLFHFKNGGTFTFEIKMTIKQRVSRFYNVNLIGKFSEIIFNGFKHELNERIKLELTGFDQNGINFHNHLPSHNIIY